MQIWELHYSFPSGSVIKDPPANTGDARDTGSTPGVEDPLEEEMTTHFSVLAWEIPWTEKSVGYGPRGCKESDTAETLSRLACTQAALIEHHTRGGLSNKHLFSHSSGG